MPWLESPSPTVLRKRLHRVGAAESGQVTSVVRYLPGASFHTHGHPQGEEILVIDGTFSDEHGDWPAGTYLLNPEGFCHTPFSRTGCDLLVKLRQYPGSDRHHIAVSINEIPWTATERPRESEKLLYKQDGYRDVTRLLRWEAGAAFARIQYESGDEYFVVDGMFADEFGTYSRGAWLRMPIGGVHHPNSADGCVLYCKTGGFAYLNERES